MININISNLFVFFVVGVVSFIKIFILTILYYRLINRIVFLNRISFIKKIKFVNKYILKNE